LELNFKIDYEKLSREFERLPEESGKELRQTLKKSLRDVAIDARLHHDFKTQSGQLERSVQAVVSDTGLSGKVFLDEGVAKYGKWVHEGTRPHKIYPKNKSALHFVIGGKSVIVPKQKNKYWQGQVASNPNATFSWKGFVNHPGTKKDQFLYEALERQSSKIIDRVQKAVKNIIKNAGL
jgi:hypothetical protein